jgi:hypothetical protein
MKITGSEANKLAYIARFPQSNHSKLLVDALDGEAKEVATALVSGSPDASEEVNSVVKALQNAK